MTRRWTINLSEAAQADFRAIVRYSRSTFGPEQAIAYRATLLSALRELEDGPSVAGSSPLGLGTAGIRTLHVARRGRRGRHLIVFRETSSHAIEVLRILHERMDLPRHVPDG